MSALFPGYLNLRNLFIRWTYILTSISAAHLTLEDLPGSKEFPTPENFPEPFDPPKSGLACSKIQNWESHQSPGPPSSPMIQK